MLRPGYSTRRIAMELEAAGVIRSRLAFILWHRIHRKQSLKAGEYLFDKTARVLDVHDRLVRGDIYVHTVVIPEGFTMFDIAQAIQDAGLGSSQEFLDVARSNVALISDLAPEAKSLEGYLFPNTYEFTRTQSMKDIAAAMVRQFRQVAEQVGLTGNRQGTAIPAEGASDIQKTVTMASIIEKETAVPEERPVVASVYYNRLARNDCSAGRSQRDLCRTAQRELFRRPASCRHAVSVRLQHLRSSWTSARAHRESRPNLSRGRHASGADGLLLFCQRRQWPPPLFPQPRRTQSECGQTAARRCRESKRFHLRCASQVLI